MNERERCDSAAAPAGEHGTDRSARIRTGVRKERNVYCDLEVGFVLLFIGTHTARWRCRSRPNTPDPPPLFPLDRLYTVDVLRVSLSVSQCCSPSLAHILSRSCAHTHGRTGGEAAPAGLRAHLHVGSGERGSLRCRSTRQRNEQLDRGDRHREKQSFLVFEFPFWGFRNNRTTKGNDW